MIHCLKIEYSTGYVSFRTYQTLSDRINEHVLLSAQPVIVTVIDYDDDEALLARMVNPGSPWHLQSTAATDGGDQ